MGLNDSKQEMRKHLCTRCWWIITGNTHFPQFDQMTKHQIDLERSFLFWPRTFHVCVRVFFLFTHIYSLMHRHYFIYLLYQTIFKQLIHPSELVIWFYSLNWCRFTDPILLIGILSTHYNSFFLT